MRPVAHSQNNVNGCFAVDFLILFQLERFVPVDGPAEEVGTIFDFHQKFLARFNRPEPEIRLVSFFDEPGRRCFTALIPINE